MFVSAGGARAHKRRRPNPNSTSDLPTSMTQFSISMEDNNQAEGVVVWLPELIHLGFDNYMPRPCPFVQALLVSLGKKRNGELVRSVAALEKSLVMKSDAGALVTLGNTLDCRQWLWFHVLARTETETTVMDWLNAVATRLESLREGDYKKNVGCFRVMSAYVKAFADAFNAANNPGASTGSGDVGLHYLLKEDELSDGGRDMLEACKGPTIDIPARLEIKHWKYPIIPIRLIDVLSPAMDFSLWKAHNKSFMAPITDDMWIILGGLNKHKPVKQVRNELRKEACKASALFIEVPWDMVHMNMLVENGCGNSVSVRLKSLEKGKAYHLTRWEWMRPYVKCMCDQEDFYCSRDAFRWFDHAVWYMMNHLGGFFPDAKSVGAQLISFLQHMQRPRVQLIIKAQIIFLYIRDMMVQAACEFSENRGARLLQNFPNCAAAATIEKFIRPVPERNSGSISRTSSPIHD